MPLKLFFFLSLVGGKEQLFFMYFGKNSLVYNNYLGPISQSKTAFGVN